MVTTAAQQGTCNWRTCVVRTTKGQLLTVFAPSRQDIENLQVGDFAPACFGHVRRVVRITARRDDVNGKLFVCYYTEHGTNSSISDDAKEGEMHDSVAWSVGSLHSEMEHLRAQVRAALVAEAVRRSPEASALLGQQLRGMHDCPECGKTVMHGSHTRLCDGCASAMREAENDALGWVGESKGTVQS